MKRLIRASTQIQLPSGWEMKTNDELEKLGYNMDPQYLDDDEKACKQNHLKLLGYAINDDEELALVCENENRKILLCGEENGKLVELD